MPPKKHEVQIVVEVPDQPPSIEGNPALVDKLLAAVLTHPNDVAATIAGSLRMDDYLFNLQHGIIIDLWVETVIACAKHGMKANKTLAVLELVETLRASIVETQSDRDAKIIFKNFFVRHAGLAAKEKEQRASLLAQLGLDANGNPIGGGAAAGVGLSGGGAGANMSVFNSLSAVAGSTQLGGSAANFTGGQTTSISIGNASGTQVNASTPSAASASLAALAGGAISGPQLATAGEAFLTSLGLTLPPLLGPDGKAVLPTGTAMMMHALGDWGGSSPGVGGMPQTSTSPNGAGSAAGGGGVDSQAAAGGAAGTSSASSASPGKGKAAANKKKGVEEPPPPPKLTFDAGFYFLDANDMKHIAPYITRGIVQHWRLYATVGAFGRTDLFVPAASAVSDAVLEPVACSFMVGIQTPISSHHLGRALTLEEHTRRHSDESAKASAERAALQAKEEAQIASEKAALEAAAARRRAAEEEEKASMLYLKKATAERAVDQLTNSIETELSERQRRIIMRIQKLEDALHLATGAAAM